MNVEKISNDQRAEDNYVFVPRWFLVAFEDAVSQSSGRSEWRECSYKIAPNIQSHDFAALLVLLRYIQKVILTDRNFNDDLVFDTQALCGGDGARMAEEDIFRVVEILPSLRVVQYQSKQTTPIPIFRDERWEKVSGKKWPVLRLRVSSQHTCFLTGIEDGHLELLRGLSLASDLERARTVFEHQPPRICGLDLIPIDVTIWMRLSDQERLVWMRMTQASAKSSNISGRKNLLIAASIEDLTKDLDWKSAAFDDRNVLMDRLKLVAGLGRKLAESKWVKVIDEGSHIALRTISNASQLAIAWQLDDLAELTRYGGEYVAKVSQRTHFHALASDLERIIEVFVRLSPRFNQEDLGRIWGSIYQIPGSGIVLNTGEMAQLHFLFLEWICRIEADPRVRLSEKYLGSALYNICENTRIENASEQFKLFKQYFVNQYETIHKIKSESSQEFCFSVVERSIKDWYPQNVELPFVKRSSAVSATISRSDKQKSKHGTKHPEKSSDHLSADSRLEGGSDSQGSVNTPKLISTIETRGAGEKSRSPLVSNRIPLKKEAPEKKKGALSDHKLKQMALEELEKMMIHAPSAYAKLKRTYIETLDPETKALVLDVQRRLDLKAFDKHLKLRLVRFMTDFPSSWNSVSSPLKV